MAAAATLQKNVKCKCCNQKSIDILYEMKKNNNRNWHYTYLCNSKLHQRRNTSKLEELANGRLAVVDISRVQSCFLHTSSFGVIPKKSKPIISGCLSWICHLPYGQSVNDGIEKEWASVTYAFGKCGCQQSTTAGERCRMVEMNIKVHLEGR